MWHCSGNCGVSVSHTTSTILPTTGVMCLPARLWFLLHQIKPPPDGIDAIFKRHDWANGMKTTTTRDHHEDVPPVWSYIWYHTPTAPPHAHHIPCMSSPIYPDAHRECWCDPHPAMRARALSSPSCATSSLLQTAGVWMIMQELHAVPCHCPSSASRREQRGYSHASGWRSVPRRKTSFFFFFPFWH